MYHCTNFKAKDIIYLFDNQDFEQRAIYIGTCPTCNKIVAELRETRIIDNKKIVSRFWGKKLNNLLKTEKTNIQYKSSEINASKFKKSTYGWIFGDNKQIAINKKIFKKEFACDFHGNKVLLSKKEL